MPDYQAPTHDMLFVLTSLKAQLQQRLGTSLDELDLELFQAIATEAAKFAQGVMTPGNREADEFASELHDGEIKTSPSWKHIYTQFMENGWVGLALPEKYGGQGLPRSMSSAIWEMWNGSNLAFTMLPQLNVAQAEALIATGDNQWEQPWLEKIVSGQWAATMNLTEPQAGSDLGATTMRAAPQEDGSYKLFGQKIFISFGEHDLTENIVHLVLARLPDAPAGHRGLSLFLAPKYLVDNEGNLGAKNDISCVSIEHKLGVRGSPTCTLVFGDDGGATAYLVGEKHAGLAQMFVMMNEARQAVALQGVGLSEKAYQMANRFAKERVQGAVIGLESNKDVAIAHHPDVKRMLLELRTTTLAMRSLCYALAIYKDEENRLQADGIEHSELTKKIEVLLPIAKGWCTERTAYNTSLAVQVFGGMGYVEETGIAQVMRDARILPIFEGTTGIQAKDLLGRKLLRDQGESVGLLLADITQCAVQLKSVDVLQSSAVLLEQAIAACKDSVQFLLADDTSDYAKYAVSVTLLEQLGLLCGGWQLAQLSLAAQDPNKKDEFGSDYCQAIQQLWYFYAVYLLPQVIASAQVIQQAGPTIEDANIDWALV